MARVNQDTPRKDAQMKPRARRELTELLSASIVGVRGNPGGRGADNDSGI
jgi:hypothetical protein